MRLTKLIPEHRKTIEFNWCKRDFLLMSQDYRKVRERMHSPMDSCSWCQHKFVDGEMMALAQPKHGKNWLLCQDCAAAPAAGEEK